MMPQDQSVDGLVRLAAAQVVDSTSPYLVAKKHMAYFQRDDERPSTDRPHPVAACRGLRANPRTARVRALIGLDGVNMFRNL